MLTKQVKPKRPWNPPTNAWTELALERPEAASFGNRSVGLAHHLSIYGIVAKICEQLPPISMFHNSSGIDDKLTMLMATRLGHRHQSLFWNFTKAPHLPRQQGNIRDWSKMDPYQKFLGSQIYRWNFHRPISRHTIQLKLKQAFSFLATNSGENLRISKTI